MSVSEEEFYSDPLNCEQEMIPKFDPMKKQSKFKYPNISLPVAHQFALLKRAFGLPKTANYSDIQSQFTSGDALLDSEKQTIEFSTSIPSLDNYFPNKKLSGGEIIEICGLEHTGKTTLISTIMIAALIHHLDTHAFYIDTKADLQLEKINKIINGRVSDSQEDLKTNIKGRIHFQEIYNLPQLITTLEEVLNSNTNYRILVIDTITAPFYHISSSQFLNKKMTCRVHGLIYQLAKEKNMTIFIANYALHIHKTSESDYDASQLQAQNSLLSSTTTESQTQETELEIKPALGYYWSEILTHRFLLMRSEDDDPKLITSSITRNIVQKQTATMTGYNECHANLVLLEKHDSHPEKNGVILNVCNEGFFNE